MCMRIEDGGMKGRVHWQRGCGRMAKRHFSRARGGNKEQHKRRCVIVSQLHRQRHICAFHFLPTHMRGHVARRHHATLVVLPPHFMVSPKVASYNQPFSPWWCKAAVLRRRGAEKADLRGERVAEGISSHPRRASKPLIPREKDSDEEACQISACARVAVEGRRVGAGVKEHKLRADAR